MKFCGLILEVQYLPQNFCNIHTHRDKQTGRHIPEIVKSCSGHSKTSKSAKNRKSNIFTQPIFSSVYIKESQNNKKVLNFIGIIIF